MRKNILKILPVLLAVLLLGTGTALWVSRGFTVSESESGTAQGEEDKTGKQTGAEAESQGGIETSGGAAESENENADMQSEVISQAEQGESVLAFHVTVLGDSIAKGYSGDKAVDIESYGSIAADKLSGELGMPYSFQNFAKNGLEGKVWQYFTIVPDFKSVGVRDNARSFDWPVIIRAVNTVDAMTATVEPIDWPVLMKITDRILKEVKNVNRVCYDMSPKPNATIEWE